MILRNWYAVTSRLARAAFFLTLLYVVGCQKDVSSSSVDNRFNSLAWKEFPGTSVSKLVYSIDVQSKGPSGAVFTASVQYFREDDRAGERRSISGTLSAEEFDQLKSVISQDLWNVGGDDPGTTLADERSFDYELRLGSGTQKSRFHEHHSGKGDRLTSKLKNTAIWHVRSQLLQELKVKYPD